MATDPPLVRPPASIAATIASRAEVSGRRVFSSQRVDELFTRTVGLGTIVFGAQAIVIGLLDPSSTARPGGVVVMVVMAAAILWLLVASLRLRGMRIASLILCWLYVIVLVLWPFVVDTPGAETQEPWVWYLLTVAGACAVYAMSIRAAVVYTLVSPMLYGVVRASTNAPDQWTLGVFDASYGIIIGLVVLVVGVTFRRSAVGVDLARDAALARYDEAVRLHAVEAERVEVDAIVHDSVLAALQAADRAASPAQARAATALAVKALAHFRDAGLAPIDSDAVVTTGELASALATAAVSMERTIAVSSLGTRERVVPSVVAEAMVLAATQAMQNSIQHAGRDAVERAVTVRATGPSAVEITITDDGEGFDPAQVEPGRLGVRVSIVERMASIGGAAVVDSAVGRGTTVRLSWAPPRAGDRT
ncbi:sensor histidine kinase [Labedella endophytica]|uniref:ATP-binding protein n=1 Tax=Labedella endophytica TaxID=1523160 RepID=A0A433JSQ5_9MICO|nr:ATP-binding protein [Labedella endophytica]RUR01351.1 ATP-binding protein [Labedella endophytica]